MTINVGRRRMALAPIASSRKQQASTDPRAMVEELPTAHPALFGCPRSLVCGIRVTRCQLGAAAWCSSLEAAQWQLGGGRKPFFAGARQIALASG